MFKAVFDESQQLTASIEDLDEKFYAVFDEVETFTAEFSSTISCHENIYEGETVVIPKAFQDQTLDTSDKVVLDDITVLEIPYTEVSNLSNGLTVIIG